MRKTPELPFLCRTQAVLKSLRTGLLAGVTAAPYVADIADPAIRGVIANPALNIFNHASNLAISADAGVLAGLIGSQLYSRYIERPDEAGRATRKARAAMAAAGLAMGIVLNTLAETKWGISVSHFFNTPDPYDAAYGIVSAAIGAAIGPKLELVPSNDQFNPALSDFAVLPA